MARAVHDVDSDVNRRLFFHVGGPRFALPVGAEGIRQRIIHHFGTLTECVSLSVKDICYSKLLLLAGWMAINNRLKALSFIWVGAVDGDHC